MKSNHNVTFGIVTSVLAVLGAMAVCAQDKYSLKSGIPGNGQPFPDRAVKAKDSVFHPYQKR